MTVKSFMIISQRYQTPSSFTEFAQLAGKKLNCSFIGIKYYAGMYVKKIIY